MNKRTVVTLVLMLAISLAGCLDDTTSDTTFGSESNGYTPNEDRSSDAGSTSGPDLVFTGNNHAYRDDIGYYNVVGEVKNEGDRNAQFVKVTGTFYYEDGTVYDTSFTFTARDIVPAGQKSPFEVSVDDSNAEIASHKLTVGGRGTSDNPPGHDALSLQGVTSNTDSIGYYHVVGEVQNDSDRSATYVKVIASFYNEDGDIIRTGFTFTDPSEIGGGEAAPFDVSEEDEGFDFYQLWIDAQAMR